MKREYITPVIKAYGIKTSAIICGSLDQTELDNSHIHKVRREEPSAAESRSDLWSDDFDNEKW